VNEGDKIASIISGESPCSTGTHLHFEVVKGSARQNPFDQLRPIGLLWDNSDSEQNGRGSWRWPINDTIRVTQGYGQTSYSSRYAGNFHTGVDMVNKDNLAVMAVKSGELYQGGMKCGSGTLRYVRVKQSDGFDTFYLHVNYF
jgi:murein DD-endopeptidase MepM/ murein hydrolase activator NlpD